MMCSVRVCILVHRNNRYNIHAPLHGQIHMRIIIFMAKKNVILIRHLVSTGIAVD